MPTATSTQPATGELKMASIWSFTPSSTNITTAAAARTPIQSPITTKEAMRRYLPRGKMMPMATRIPMSKALTESRRAKLTAWSMPVSLPPHAAIADTPEGTRPISHEQLPMVHRTGLCAHSVILRTLCNVPHGVHIPPPHGFLIHLRAHRIARILHKKAYLCLNSSTG